jgi:hypothetical protein
MDYARTTLLLSTVTAHPSLTPEGRRPRSGSPWSDTNDTRRTIHFRFSLRSRLVNSGGTRKKLCLHYHEMNVIKKDKA